jgi:hypothetical protein
MVVLAAALMRLHSHLDHRHLSAGPRALVLALASDPCLQGLQLLAQRLDLQVQVQANRLEALMH